MRSASVRQQRPQSRTRLIVVVAVAAAALLALTTLALEGADRSATTGVSLVPPSGDSGRGAGPSDEKAGGAPAPAFSVPVLDGSSFSVPAGKPAILFFMAGWCSSCIPEAQALDRIARSEGERVAVLAVDTDPAGTVAALEGFIEAAGSPGYGFARDPEGRLVQAYSVHALDTTVVIDGSGRIVYRDAVPTTEGKLRAALATAGVG